MREKKKVLVLGAGAVGKAIVKRYLAEGCSVAVCDDNNVLLEAVAKEYPEIQTYLVDDVKDVQKAAGIIDKAEADLGGIDGYIHTLNHYNFVPFEDMSLAQMKEVRGRCLDSAFAWGQQMGNKLRGLGKGGFILFVINDICAGKDELDIVRCVTQWGVKGLMRSMALTYGPFGVTVNCVCPGELDAVEDATRRELKAAYLGTTREEFEKNVGKLQTPEEVAEFCAFTTWEAINISGQAVLINGGRFTN